MKRPPNIIIMPSEITAIFALRFDAKVDRSGDCHLWTGAKNNAGYGAFRLNGRQVYAHRVAWVRHHGTAIPAGLTIDHLCRNQSCVRPDHLEAVTSAVNTNRVPNAFSTRTHCPQGHAYTGINLYTFPDGRRACRICMRDAKKRYKARRAA